ncbi:MAG TPA: hypothetical protein VL523_01425, partial [Terriglobia bacterium]|nr:hypothetical protein [Terriglobia bacterium]
MQNKLSLMLLLFVSCLPASSHAQTPEFITFASAHPALAAMPGSLPPELKAADPITAAAWDRWVRSRDREIRSRVQDGEEITLMNLLRLGVTFTKQERIDFDALDSYGRSPTLNAIAEHRANDLVRALAAPGPAEGLVEMREFLERQGFNLKTSEGRRKSKAYLLARLARLRDNLAHERKEVKSNKFEGFKDRGLSTDSDLFADYTVELQLRHMAEKGLLKPGSVHRVAIVGPGLDFVNKKDGADFYPPQTTQPFAVIDSLARLGLADPASVEVSTFDISPRVNRHIERARKNAASGQPYVVQLMSTQSEVLVPGFREYWNKLGDRIGKPVAPIPVPEALRGLINSSAVSVRP